MWLRVTYSIKENYHPIFYLLLETVNTLQRLWKRDSFPQQSSINQTAR